MDAGLFHRTFIIIRNSERFSSSVGDEGAKYKYVLLSRVEQQSPGSQKAPSHWHFIEYNYCL